MPLENIVNQGTELVGYSALVILILKEVYTRLIRSSLENSKDKAEINLLDQYTKDNLKLRDRNEKLEEERDAAQLELNKLAIEVAKLSASLEEQAVTIATLRNELQHQNQILQQLICENNELRTGQ